MSDFYKIELILGMTNTILILFFFRYGIVLPWFVFYMSDIPSLNSTSVFGFTMSNKIMTYLLGLQVALGSSQNFIMAMSALVCKLGLAKQGLWGLGGIILAKAQCFHMEVKVAVLNAISQSCN